MAAILISGANSIEQFCDLAAYVETSLIRLKAFFPSSILKYLIVPVIETLSGIIFAAVPPLIVARPNVTVSFESILLTHAEDNDIRTLAAPKRGLIERSGLEP